MLATQLVRPAEFPFEKGEPAAVGQVEERVNVATVVGQNPPQSSRTMVSSRAVAAGGV